MSRPACPLAARSLATSNPDSAGRNLRLRVAQPQRQSDQALLGAVVQVALDPLAHLVGGGDDPGARGGHFGPCLGVGDRGRHQLSESGKPRLGIRRQDLIAHGPHQHGAP